MLARIKLRSPDELTAELTITATVKEFRLLRDAIEANYHGLKVRDAIRDVIDQAEKTFYHRGGNAETDV